MSETLPLEIGAYRIEAKVAATPTAVILDGHDPRLQKKVRIKVLTAGLDAAERARFHREARALMSVEHPNVVLLYDYSGPDEAQPYIVYEPLTGKTLRALFEHRGTFPADVHAAIFVQLCRGLSALHALGIAHRDLSPDNIYVEDNGRIVIDGLGAAVDVNAVDGTLMSRGTTIHAANRYTSPEVKAGGPRDLSADMFAVCTMMHETLPEWPAPATDRPTAMAICEKLAMENPEQRLFGWLHGGQFGVDPELERLNQARRLLEAGEHDAALLAATAGRYADLSLLGQGGMGRVVKAWDRRMKRFVAIKTMLAPEADTEAAMRFHREARALGRVRHANVLEVLDYSGRGAPLPYIVFALIDGVTLAQVLQIKLFDELSAIAVLAEIAGAVAAIHAQGLVHRDLKPENIFIESNGRVVIGDFGIVRGYGEAEGTFVRGVTRAIGSPLFASPEQVESPDTVEPRSDIFSLGSTLHALLTGVSPFTSKSVSAAITRLVSGKPDPLPPGVGPFLRTLQKDMMARRAEQRPTAEALGERLRVELVERRVLDVRESLRAFLGTQDAGQTNILTSVTQAKAVLSPATVTNIAKKADLPAKPARASLRLVAAAAVAVLVATAAVVGWRMRKPPAPVAATVIASEIPSAEPALPSPSPAEPVPNVPALPAPPDPAPKPVPTPPPAAVRKAPSVVRFFTKQWAKVTVDGEVLGTTPVLQSTELSAGRHTVLFENPAFLPKRVTLDVKPGEKRDLRVELQK